MTCETSKNTTLAKRGYILNPVCVAYSTLENMDIKYMLQ